MTFVLQVVISNQSPGDLLSLTELGRKEKTFPCADCRGKRAQQDEESASHKRTEQADENRYNLKISVAMIMVLYDF